MHVDGITGKPLERGIENERITEMVLVWYLGMSITVDDPKIRCVDV